MAIQATNIFTNGILNISAPSAKNRVDATAEERRVLMRDEFRADIDEALFAYNLLDGVCPMQTLVNTASVTQYAVGTPTLQVMVPGIAPQGTKSDWSRRSVLIERTVFYKESLYELEAIQAIQDPQATLAKIQGKGLAQFQDQSKMIQIAKAGLLTNTLYDHNADGSRPAGHAGASQVTLAAAADLQDPVKVLAGLSSLMTEMRKKNVDPLTEGGMVIVNWDVFNTLMSANALINTDLLTSAGNRVNGGFHIQHLGIPIRASNNMPKGTITGHELSTTANSNAFDGDFTKLVALMFCPGVIRGYQNIPPTADVWWSDDFMSWHIQLRQAFTIAPARSELGGVLRLA